MTETNHNGHAATNGQARTGTTRGPRYDAAELGFRDYWYPGSSPPPGRQACGAKMLGENVVFFRAHGQRLCPARPLRPSGHTALHGHLPERRHDHVRLPWLDL